MQADEEDAAGAEKEDDRLDRLGIENRAHPAGDGVKPGQDDHETGAEPEIVESAENRFGKERLEDDSPGEEGD